MKEVRDVVAQIKDAVLAELATERHTVVVQSVAVGIVGKVGNKIIIAYSLAIGIKFKITHSGDKGFGLPDGFGDVKGFSKEGGDIFFGSAYPLCFPIIGAEKAHAPKGRLAPFGDFVALVPRADAPPIVFATL